MDSAMEARPALTFGRCPVAMACSVTLPKAEASAGPLTTVRLQASAVIWQSNVFRLRLSPWLTQTVKTMFAVRCEILDRQDHFSAF